MLGIFGILWSLSPCLLTQCPYCLLHGHSDAHDKWIQVTSVDLGWVVKTLYYQLLSTQVSCGITMASLWVGCLRLCPKCWWGENCQSSTICSVWRAQSLQEGKVVWRFGMESPKQSTWPWNLHQLPRMSSGLVTRSAPIPVGNSFSYFWVACLAGLGVVENRPHIIPSTWFFSCPLSLSLLSAHIYT